MEGDIPQKRKRVLGTNRSIWYLRSMMEQLSQKCGKMNRYWLLRTYDNDIEQEGMTAIDGLRETWTLIIIAHRLTTIINCDMIYEVKEGDC